MNHKINRNIFFLIFLSLLSGAGLADPFMMPLDSVSCGQLIVANNHTLCRGTPDTLTLLNPGAAQSILWSTGGTTSSINVSPVNTTRYYVTVTDTSNLTCTDSVNIIVNPTYSTLVNTSICQGDTLTLPGGTLATAAGTYPVTFESIASCDSTITTVLTLNPVYNINHSVTICQGDTVTLPGGAQETLAGIYHHTFSTVRGCDSTIATTVSLNPTYDSTVYASICQGIQFTLPNGSHVTAAGIYPVTLQSVHLCDSTIVTVLSIKPVYHITQNPSICPGDTFFLPNGQGRTTAGTYIASMQTVGGCDSVITFNLTIRPVYSIIRNASFCQGSSYTLPGGQVVSTVGTYRDTLQTILGCDSIIRTNLTMLSVFHVSVNAAICPSDSFQLPNGNFVSSAGSYPVTLHSVGSCDSIVTTVLSNYPSWQVSHNVSICQGSSYTLPNNQVVTQAGTYHDTLQTINGCDSVVTTILIVKPVYLNTVHASICPGSLYTLPNGSTVGNAGTYNSALHTTLGCDSTIVTILSIRPSYQIIDSVSVCFGSTYTLANGVVKSTAGTYPVMLQTVGGCDSLITTILSIGQFISNTNNISICQGDSYTLPHGQIVSTAGTYRDTLHTPTGCDSLIVTVLAVNPNYSINVNASFCQGSNYVLPSGQSVSSAGVYPSSLHTHAGCDSIITTTLSVKASYHLTASASICQGSSYQLPGGQSVSTSGIYRDTLHTVLGCDSVITTTLIVKPTYSISINDYFCQGAGYTLPNGLIVHSAGVYPVTLQTVGNCDSVITTTLTERQVYHINQNISLCQGSTYTLPGGQLVSTAGTFHDTLQSSGGCDSIITTVITLNPVFSTSRNASLCQGNSYTLPGGQSVSASGTYHDTLTATNGCDSIVTTVLTVKVSYHITRNASMCQGDGYTLPNAVVVHSSGTYPVIMSTMGGCDSVITTNLTVHPSYSYNRSASVCQGQSYTLPNYQVVSSAGIYRVFFVSTLGCDSVITTTLTLKPVYHVAIDTSICQGGQYTLPGGQHVNSAGTYIASYTTTGSCDSTITTTLHVNPVYSITNNVSVCAGSVYMLPDSNIVNTAGTYPVMLQSLSGCDSLVTTILHVGVVINNTINASLCQGSYYQLPNGQLVNFPGTYIIHYQTTTGCDSAITTILSVHAVFDTTIYSTICQGDNYPLPNGQLVTTPGTFTTTLYSIYGCDSVITTSLSVNISYHYISFQTICQGQSFLLPDSNLVSIPGTYVSTFETMDGCDSAFTTVLNVTSPPTYSFNADVCLGHTYILPDSTPVTQSGNYQCTLNDPNGCDSLVFVFVTFIGFPPSVITGPDSVTSFQNSIYYVTSTPGHSYSWSVIGGTIISGDGTDSIVVNWITSGTGVVRLYESDSQCSNGDSLVVHVNGTVGLPHTDSPGIVRLYPNPVDQKCTVEWTGIQGIEKAYVFDISGALLKEFSTKDVETLTLDFSEYAPGIYFVRLLGSVNYSLRVIRQ